MSNMFHKMYAHKCVLVERFWIKRNFVILKLKLLGKKRAKLPLMGTELQYKITYYENT